MCESERKGKTKSMYLFCLTVEIILKYLHFHILRKNPGKKDGGETRARWGIMLKTGNIFQKITQRVRQ